MDIARIINAIEELLEREDCLSEDVIAIADSVLIDVWFIDDAQTRIQIIQEAAVRCGLLRARDID